LHWVPRRMNRLYANLLHGLTLTALTAAAIQGTLEERNHLREAGLRAISMLSGMEENIRTYFEQGRVQRIRRIAQKFVDRQQVAGIALCAPAKPGSPVWMGYPADLPWTATCLSAQTEKTIEKAEASSWQIKNGNQVIQYSSLPLEASARSKYAQALILAEDVSDLRLVWLQSFLRTLAMAWIAGAALLVLIATQVRRWLKGYFRYLYQALRALASGRRPPAHLARNLVAQGDPVLLSRDIGNLTRKILTLPVVARQTKSEPSWLLSLRNTLRDRNIVIFANREPYIHQRKGKQIEVTRPASGLVTALEPILRQCGGLWIGHGSGSADKETCNSRGELPVPPGNPSYTLKRVWLTQEEEEGYYYGFSNEGLWPLCHLAHNRPTFRLSDWENYRTVNQRFCQSTPESALDGQSLILVQDYHFALLPRMLRARAMETPGGGRAPKISLFWHIPWPNPEAFGICPWNKELLVGMLGADVVGFHTQYHCNNFLETCDRYLEARIDWENFSVTMENHETLVRAFPIGIDTSPVRTLPDQEREELKARYGIQAELVAVGVDRIDYTKGLIERVEAVERFLEKNPSYVGRFSLVQMGSPSRTHIQAYQNFNSQLEQVVDRVNTRFGTATGNTGYRPVIFIPSTMSGTRSSSFTKWATCAW
jgi:trehalose-6-phosphate synthase